MPNANEDVATALLTSIFNLPYSVPLFTMKMPKHGKAQGSHLRCLAVHNNKIMDITPAVAAVLDLKLARQGTLYLNAPNTLAGDVSMKLFGNNTQVTPASL